MNRLTNLVVFNGNNMRSRKKFDISTCIFLVMHLKFWPQCQKWQVITSRIKNERRRKMTYLHNNNTTKYTCSKSSHQTFHPVYTFLAQVYKMLTLENLGIKFWKNRQQFLGVHNFKFMGSSLKSGRAERNREGKW